VRIKDRSDRTAALDLCPGDSVAAWRRETLWPRGGGGFSHGKDDNQMKFTVEG